MTYFLIGWGITAGIMCFILAYLYGVALSQRDRLFIEAQKALAGWKAELLAHAETQLAWAKEKNECKP